MSAAKLLGQAKRIVVKIGSALLVDANGGLNEAWLNGLMSDVANARASGTDVVLVSSGAIALGRHALGLGLGALSLEQSQAAAAVGQIRLSRAYETALASHKLTAAQLLVTLEDSENRRRYLNTRATLQTLLQLGCVPIVNENDTVATDEIRFGDNDRLAAQIAALAGADVLFLLSDVDGLYTDDPANPSAEHLPLIDAITPQIEAMAAGSANAIAKGGMKTKIMAAKTATAAGCAMVISNGSSNAPLSAIANGARTSVFAASATPAAARKQWIDTMKPRGTITIDAGAVAALKGGKSLLPAGVVAISGDFQRGDPVDVLGPQGDTVARGLVSYAAGEAGEILGLHSSEISERLGYPGRAALIHRNDMAL